MSVCELLPWFAAGSLDAAERSAVVLHLVTCAECRQELAFWQSFVPRLQSEVSSLPGSPPSPQNPSNSLTHELLREVLHLVPISIPTITIYTAEVAFESPAGVTSLVRLSVPTVQSQSIADWLFAAAGN